MNAAAPHAFPALHNAMWPGLVGKGPDSEPPIDLDTMLDLTAATRVDGVAIRWRRPLPVAAAHRHRFLRRRPRASRRQARLEGTARRIAGRARLAAHRRRLRHGRRGRARPLPHPGEKGLPHRPQTARSRASANTASCASIPRPAPPIGPRIPTANTKKHRPDVPRSRDDRRRVRRAPRRRRRDLLGRHA